MNNPINPSFGKIPSIKELLKKLEFTLYGF